MYNMKKKGGTPIEYSQSIMRSYWTTLWKQQIQGNILKKKKPHSFYVTIYMKFTRKS